MDCDYIVDVFAGSKACIVGYIAVQLYEHIIGIYKRSGKRGKEGRSGEGRKTRGGKERKCKEAKVK